MLNDSIWHDKLVFSVTGMQWCATVYIVISMHTVGLAFQAMTVSCIPIKGKSERLTPNLF